MRALLHIVPPYPVAREAAPVGCAFCRPTSILIRLDKLIPPDGLANEISSPRSHSNSAGRGKQNAQIGNERNRRAKPFSFQRRDLQEADNSAKEGPGSTEGDDAGQHDNGRNTRTQDKTGCDEKNQGGGKERCEILARAPAHQQIANQASDESTAETWHQRPRRSGKNNRHPGSKDR